MTATLVLLSYNERESLAALIKRIPFERFDSVFAVDGGSTDGTGDLYKNHSIRCYTQDRIGRGNAFRLALKKTETDCVVFFSTDGNENPEDLPLLLKFLREGFDMVVAGRYGLPGSATDDSDDRLLLRKGLGVLGGWIIRKVWGSNVHDPINGFRGFQTEALKRMKLDAEGHDIELQGTIRAAKLGLRVKEFPTRELRRIGGQRKSSAGTCTLVLRLGWALLREACIGKRV